MIEVVKHRLALPVFIILMMASAFSFQSDSIKTSMGEMKVTFIGHSSLIFQINKMVIYCDPWSKLADYSKFPKADLILITHEHFDHLDTGAISSISKQETKVFSNALAAKQIADAQVLNNGDHVNYGAISIEAVPAYNIIHIREDGQPYHPKGVGNGYIVTFGDKRIYIAGDTEDIPEMKALKNIEIAFLPMNIPYTMTPEMVVHAVALFHPSILYPYHTGETDVKKLLPLLKGSSVEVRIRSLR